MNLKTFVIKIPPQQKKAQKTKTRGSIRFTDKGSKINV